MGLVALLAAWSLTCCPAAHADATWSDYQVQQGDALQVYVHDEEQLIGTYMVGNEGAIVVPMVGPVKVAGKTLTQIRDLLRAKLAEIIRDPFVTVGIDDANSVRKVFISGYVDKKGPLTVPIGANVRDAVATAIPTPEADLSRVQLNRPGQDPREINLAGLRDDSILGAPVPLRYGDVIHVPRIEELVSVLGEVKRPGAMALPSGERLTVLEAINKIGDGFTQKADINTALLLRKNVAQPITIDLRGIIKEGRMSENYQLHAGDVVLIRTANEIAVVGHVNSPIAFYSEEPVKITEAIIRAGGFAEDADPGGAKIYRNGQYAAIDLDRLWQDGDMSQNAMLEAGDTLIVPERRPSEVVLLGALTKTGPANLAGMRNTSLLKIVTMAEPTTAGDLSQVHVYRGDEHMVIDLKQIEEDGDITRDIQLKQGDVVVVPERQPEEVVLLGALTKVGPVSVADVLNRSLLKFVLLAEPTIYADMRRVQVYRGEEQWVVNLKQIEEDGDMSHDVQLEAGDVVVVSDTEKVYLIGAFGKPGVYPYDPKQTLFDYIARAQLTSAAAQEPGSLVRVREDGKTDVVKIDLAKITKGQLPRDLTVKGGDIICFPPPRYLAGRKSLWDFIRENLWVINLFRD